MTRRRWDHTLKTKKWALVYLGEPKPFICSVSDFPTLLREDMGKLYKKRGETAKEGWTRAYKLKWRICPVTVALYYQGDES